MTESRNCVVTTVHYNRPDYTRRVLAALAACDGAADCTLLCRVEPANEEVVAILRAADFCETRVFVNESRVRADPSTIRVLDAGFALSDFVVHLEDDVVLAPDALQYFWWARARYCGDRSVGSVSGYNRDRTPPHPTAFHAVRRRAWFHPWGCAFWRDRWAAFRPLALHLGGVDPATLRLTGRGTLGWDGAVWEAMKPLGMGEVHPVLSRVQNIGERTSIHDPRWFTREWHRENQHVPHFAGDRCVAPGEFREEAP